MAARHKQSVPAAVRARRIGVPLVTLLALGSVAGASASPDNPPTGAAHPPVALSAPAPVSQDAERRDGVLVSRSGERPATAEPPVPRAGTAIGHARVDLQARWLSADLNVWSGPGEHTRLLRVLDEGERVGVTGSVRGEWAQIGHNGSLAWVRAAYLAEAEPEAPEPADPADSRAEPAEGDPADSQPEAEPPAEAPAVTDQPCADGADVESGLVANAVTVYRSVCAAFPEVTSWGGLRPGDDGFHGSGQAVDIMTPDSAVGDRIAAYVLQHSADLGVSEILWAQQIWTAERSSEGWRPLEDRGSVTANHYDHVHVSVY